MASNRATAGWVRRNSLRHYVTMRMPDRGGAPGGTAELYFTDPDGLLMTRRIRVIAAAVARRQRLSQTVTHHAQRAPR